MAPPRIVRVVVHAIVAAVLGAVWLLAAAMFVAGLVLWQDWHALAREGVDHEARVMNCEMEAGILLTLAGLFGVRAGAICVVSDRTPWPGPSALDLDRNMGDCIEVATRAMLALAR